MSEWIDVDYELPENDDYVLISFANYGVPQIGRYVEDDDEGGNWYLGDDDVPCLEQDMIVNAWMPLPEPYEG